MSTSAALGKMFGAASVALFATAAYWTYGAQSQKQTQMIVTPARSHLPRAPPAPHTAAPSSPPPPSSAALTEADAAFPVVLPPRTPTSQVAQLTADFAARCAETAHYGLPSTAEVRCYGGYLASLNYERRIPNWVMEVVDHRRLRGGRRGSDTSADDDDSDAAAAAEVSRQHSAFYADATVPAAFRVGPDGYTSRGLSRGHLAPAQLHKASQAEMDATFNMNANMVPQDMTLNAVDWLRLEGMTRKISKELSLGQRRGSGKGKKGAAPAAEGEQGGGKLYVVSGPAFVPQLVRVERKPDGTEAHVPLPASEQPLSASASGARGSRGLPPNVVPMLSYALTGDVAGGALVAVPTHLFKVFLAEEGEGGRLRSTAAFLMPNGPITEQQPLTAYQVPVERVERLTGLQFFPGVDTTRLPDMCTLHNCDARPAALFQRYRQVAQLRAADSVPQLRKTYAALQSSAAGGKLDESVVREFEKRTEELVAQAIGPIDALERR